MKESRSLRVDPDVVGFAARARVFCDLLEKDVADRKVWLRQLLGALADLFAAAHHLPVPDIDPASTYPAGKFEFTRAEYQALFHRIGSILDDERFYSYSFDPGTLPDSPQPPEVGDLADDLADIYRDVKPGLRAWDANVEDYLADTVFDWKEPLFGSHWGRHAVDALRVLHGLVYD